MKEFKRLVVCNSLLLNFILVAKLYFPGLELYFLFAFCFCAVIYLVIEHILINKKTDNSQSFAKVNIKRMKNRNSKK